MPIKLTIEMTSYEIIPVSKLVSDGKIGMLKDYGHSNLGEKRFIALIQPDNVASKRIANKLGMNLEKKVILGGQNVHVHSISQEYEHLK